MSYSLSALQSGQGFRFNNSGWYEVLRLGQACGWQPAGTVMEPDWADYLRQFVTFARASGGFNLG